MHIWPPPTHYNKICIQWRVYPMFAILNLRVKVYSKHKTSILNQFPILKLVILHSLNIALLRVVFKLQKHTIPMWPPYAIFDLRVKVNSKMKNNVMNEFPILKLVILHSLNIVLLLLVIKLQTRPISIWPPAPSWIKRASRNFSLCHQIFFGSTHENL